MFLAKVIQRHQASLNRRLYRDPGFSVKQGKHPIHGEILRWLEPFRGSRTLEIGCGPGRYVGMLACNGFDVVGVDPFSFPEWKELGTDPRISLIPNVRAENLPFKDASFDNVCCMGALLYFDSPEKALSEIRRVLKPGGRLVLRSVNRANRYTTRTGNPIDPAAKHLYTEPELVTLLTDFGFVVKKSFTFGFYPSRIPNVYWFLQNVVFKFRLDPILSRLCSRKSGVNVVIHAAAPARSL